MTDWNETERITETDRINRSTARISTIAIAISLVTILLNAVLIAKRLGWL